MARSRATAAGSYFDGGCSAWLPCFVGAAALAVATERGATLGIDQAILFALHSWRDGRPVGPVWLAEAVPDVIALGSTTVLFVTTVLAVVYLASDSPKMASTLLLTVMSAQATSTILKRLVDRQRPTIPNAPTVFAATNSVA